MNNYRRKFLKIFGLTFLSFIIVPYNLLYSVTKKILNPNLTNEQKKIMLQESTEKPFSSSLNNEKRKGFFIVLIVAQNFLILVQSLTAEQVGLLSQSLYLVLLKLKLTTHSGLKE